ncbi:MAG: ATP synthase subunit C [Nitrososphaerota archaeon]
MAAEQPALTSEAAQVKTAKFLSMALSVGICSAAAAYAVAKVSVATIASAAERPEILGRALIFVGLAEGIAIYGLLIAILIWITTV